jgi:hypothetical protein
MKRTPIILPGQVYLHYSLNEYIVVTKSTRGDVRYRGKGFSGMNEVELFLERCGPVDPEDLTITETADLTALLSEPGPLLIGWVTCDDDETDDEAF